MLNILIKRASLAVALLLCAGVGIWAFTHPDASFGMSLVLFAVAGIVPACLLVGAAYLLCWILGPVGSYGDNDKRRYYEIVED